MIHTMAADTTPSRSVWFTDRFGASIDAPIDLPRFAALLDSLAVDDGDSEHRSISVTDEHEWNLEYYPTRVLFENVGPDGGELAAQFIAGDLDALHARFA
jgi:hypothetical protein